MKTKKRNNFFDLSIMFLIFALMHIEDKKLIDRLLNHDKTVGDDFYNFCEPTITHIIIKYYSNRKDREDLKIQLLNELYLYIMKDEGKMLRNFTGDKCRIKTYINSIAYFYLSSFKIDQDPAVRDMIKEHKKKKRKEDKAIAMVDEDLVLFLPDYTPKGFKEFDAINSDKAYFKIDDPDNSELSEANTEGENEEEKGIGGDEDLILDIHSLADDVADEKDNNSLRRCRLVHETLILLPERESFVLKKLFFENSKLEVLAKELKMTIKSTDNLKRKAFKDFQHCFKTLIKQENEKD